VGSYGPLPATAPAGATATGENSHFVVEVP